VTDPATQSPPAVLARSARRLHRSRRDRVLGGVCGGIARYLDIDPVLLRVAAVALALSGGLGVLAYIVAWVLIPEADDNEPERTAPPAERHSIAIAMGAALIGLAVLLLARQWMPWFGPQAFWPIVVVAVGIVVLVSARRPRS
jgi:phage shock protein C